MMEDRRRELRWMCADLVKVRIEGASGAREEVANLEDISPSGACLQMEAPVGLGTAIRWSCADREFKGNVRYCVYREIGYFVGVEFGADSRWSKKAFRPQHLLDLKKLIG